MLREQSLARTEACCHESDFTSERWGTEGKGRLYARTKLTNGASADANLHGSRKKSTGYTRVERQREDGTNNKQECSSGWEDNVGVREGAASAGIGGSG